MRNGADGFNVYFEGSLLIFLLTIVFICVFLYRPSFESSKTTQDFFLFRKTEKLDVTGIHFIVYLVSNVFLSKPH